MGLTHRLFGGIVPFYFLFIPIYRCVCLSVVGSRRAVPFVGTYIYKSMVHTMFRFALLRGRYFLVLPRKYPKKAPQGRRYDMSFKNASASGFSYTSTFTGSTYSVKMDASRHGRQVYCVVTDKYGNSVRSNTVTLKMS